MKGPGDIEIVYPQDRLEETIEKLHHHWHWVSGVGNKNPTAYRRVVPSAHDLGDTRIGPCGDICTIAIHALEFTTRQFDDAGYSRRNNALVELTDRRNFTDAMHA